MSDLEYDRGELQRGWMSKWENDQQTFKAVSWARVEGTVP